MELPVDVIERAWRRLVLHGRAHRLAAEDALKAEASHQALDGAACDTDALARQLTPHLPRAIDLEVLGKDLFNLGLQRHVPLRPG